MTISKDYQVVYFYNSFFIIDFPSINDIITIFGRKNIMSISRSIDF